MAVLSGTRIGGQSARSAATYILRTGRYEGDSDEVRYATSDHMPGWAADDPIAYWDAADLYERANGRLYKSVQFALPVELDDRGRRALAVSFAHHLTDDEKLPFTLAIHAGKNHNPHCHLMISERQNDSVPRPAHLWFRRNNQKEPDKGGAKKTTTLRPRQWLVGARETWANLTNMFLRRAGHDDRIDHRTLAAQGIDRKPGVHLGPALSRMKEKGLDVYIVDENDIVNTEINLQWEPLIPETPALTDPSALAAADILAPTDWAPPALRPYQPKTAADKGKVARETKTKIKSDDSADTAQNIRSQLAGLNSEAYDILIEHSTGEQIKQRWRLETILANLKELKRLNDLGRNILIRPPIHPLTGLVLVSGLTKEKVEQMHAEGCEPAVTLESSPGVYQVWVRVGEQLLTSRRVEISRHLAETYGGEPATRDSDSFGWLAGFTNRNKQPDSQPNPVVLCQQSDSSGQPATGAAELLRVARERIAQRGLDQDPDEALAKDR